MSFSIVMSVKARSDLREIYEYIAYVLQSELNASRQIEKIRHIIMGLDEMPERHPVLECTFSQGKQLRCIPAGNFNIYYSINHEEHQVNIIRILYKRRSVEGSLSADTLDI